MTAMTADDLFNQLSNEIFVEIAFRSFQKQMTTNSVCPHCNQQCEMINEKAGLDIYGNRIDSNGGISQPVSTANSSSNEASSTSSMLTVECPCCKKILAATRFAPHLEKCMGMGRQSARKRGNLMMKMAAGSENESDDGGSDIILRTPAALQLTEDTFSQPSSGGGIVDPGSVEQVKKAKVSPAKSKNTTTPVNSNSKQASPSKAKRTTPSKGKSVIKK